MTHVRRILVATDFSPHSHAALEGAGVIAARTSAAIDVIHVWEPPLGLPLKTTAASHGGSTLSELARKEAQKKLQAFLAGIRKPLRQRIEVGSASELIVTLAASERFDLIVMGKSGAGRNPSHMGSVTRRVLDAAPCPVLTLRAPAPNRTAPSPAEPF